MQNKEDMLNYQGKTMEIIWNGVIAKVKIELINMIE